MRLSRLIMAAAIALLSLGASARAESIVFQSTFSAGTNQVYTYGLQEDPLSVIHFNYGDTITLTGLSGVIGAQAGSVSNCFSASYTPTSATLTETVFGGGCDYRNDTTSSLNVISFLFVQSTVLTEGSVSYAINATPGASGTTTGPVAAVATTPEPSCLVLLATGLAGMGVTLRRRVSC